MSEADVKEALRRLCAGLPVSPLPPPRHCRDDAIPHAPRRVHALNARQQKVYVLLLYPFLVIQRCCLYTVIMMVMSLTS